jgi:hypothetical protein
LSTKDEKKKENLAYFLDKANTEKMAARGIYLVPTLLGSYSRRQGGADKALQKGEKDLKRMGDASRSPKSGCPWRSERE